MSDQEQNLPAGETPERGEATASSRRNVLKLGALAVPAVATLSPSMAMATYGGGNFEPPGSVGVSLTTCGFSGLPTGKNVIDSHGEEVPAGAEIKSTWVGGKKYEYYLTDKNDPYSWRLVFDGPDGGLIANQDVRNGMAYYNISEPGDLDGPAKNQFGAHLRYLQKNKQQSGIVSCFVSMWTA